MKALRSRSLPAAVLAFVLALLVGCAQMQTRPKGFNDRVADTLQVTDEVVTMTRTALAAKKISPDDAANVSQMAKSVKEGAGVVLDLAAKECPAAQPTCVPTSASARLRMLDDILTSMQRYVPQGAK